MHKIGNQKQLGLTRRVCIIFKKKNNFKNHRHKKEHILNQLLVIGKNAIKEFASLEYFKIIKLLHMY